MTHRRYPKTIKILNSFATEIISHYRKRLATADSYYTSGPLYNTINVNSVEVQGSDFIIKINLEEYWKYIEYGRRAGAKRPPIKAIHNWIIKRNIIPRPITLKSGQQVIPSQLSLAFIFANSIAKKGIKPRPFMYDSINYVKDRFINELKTALIQDIRDMK